MFCLLSDRKPLRVFGSRVHDPADACTALRTAPGAQPHTPVGGRRNTRGKGRVACSRATAVNTERRGSILHVL